MRTFQQHYLLLRAMLKGTGIADQEKLAYYLSGQKYPRVIIMMAIVFRTFPRSYDEFDVYIRVAIPYLLANSPRLISTENRDALLLLYNLSSPVGFHWISIRAKLADPVTHSSYWVKLEKTRRHEIEQLMFTVFANVPRDVYTEADRTTLRRPLKSTSHTPAQIMGVAPLLTTVELFHMGLKVHLQDPETPDSDEMPQYQHIRLEYYLGASGLELDKIPFAHATDVTHALYLISLDESAVGQTLYVRAIYVNSKGQDGKFWSKILIEKIS